MQYNQPPRHEPVADGQIDRLLTEHNLLIGRVAHNYDAHLSRVAAEYDTTMGSFLRQKFDMTEFTGTVDGQETRVVGLLQQMPPFIAQQTGELATKVEDFLKPDDATLWQQIKREAQVNPRSGTVDYLMARSSSQEVKRGMRAALDQSRWKTVTNLAKHESPTHQAIGFYIESASSDEVGRGMKAALDQSLWETVTNLAKHESPTHQAIGSFLNKASSYQSVIAMKSAFDQKLWQLAQSIAKREGPHSNTVRFVLSQTSTPQVGQVFEGMLNHLHDQPQQPRYEAPPTSFSADDFLRNMTGAGGFFDQMFSGQQRPSAEHRNPGTPGASQSQSSGDRSRSTPPPPPRAQAPPSRPSYQVDIDAYIAQQTAAGVKLTKIRAQYARRYHPDTNPDADPNILKYVTNRLAQLEKQQREQ